jgi:hypothetical protein
MMTTRLPIARPTALLAGLLLLPPAADDVTVDGVTYVSDNDDKVRETSGIRIQAYREGPIFPAPRKSGDKGVYGVQVPAGKPFRMVYFDDANTFVPVSSNPLVANNGATHRINPVLYTGAKFVRVSGSAGLKNENVRWIRPTDGGEVVIPTTGRDQIVVALTNGGLHFRVFDTAGKMVFDVDEKDLKGQAARVDQLKRQLMALPPSPELSGETKGQVVGAVTTIVGHDRLQRNLEQILAQIPQNDPAAGKVREQLAELNRIPAGIDFKRYQLTPQYAAGAPGTAVRYQLPPQYAAGAPGTTVNYGGANYVINPDRTMSPAAFAAQPAANAVRYQIPPQYAASAPGTTVNYGGANYVVNADRTMSPVAAAARPAANAVRYQIPAQFAGSAPGATVNYGGANYVINNDNTMSPAAR